MTKRKFTIADLKEAIIVRPKDEILMDIVQTVPSKALEFKQMLFSNPEYKVVIGGDEFYFSTERVRALIVLLFSLPYEEYIVVRDDIKFFMMLEEEEEAYLPSDRATIGRISIANEVYHWEYNMDQNYLTDEENQICKFLKEVHNFWKFFDELRWSVYNHIIDNDRFDPNTEDEEKASAIFAKEFQDDMNSFMEEFYYKYTDRKYLRFQLGADNNEEIYIPNN